MSSPNRLERKFQKSLDERWLLRFSTIDPSDPNADGVVVAIKPEFIVVCVERNWEFDGFQIIPKRSITGVRDGKYEACGNRIIRDNQSLDHVWLPPWIDACEDVEDVLHSMKQEEIWPIVEALYDNNQQVTLYIGPITKFGTNAFWIRCYDAAGKWENQYAIDYTEVVSIEVGSQYARHFNAYMKSQSEKRTQNTNKSTSDNHRKRNGK